MNLEKRKQEIKVRLNEIKGLTGVEATLELLEDLEKEVDELKEEEETIDRKLAIQRKAVINPIQIERTDQVNKEELEKRGAMLKEARVIQVSSEEILLPEHTAPNIAAYPFAQVSSLVDRVKVVNLNGGETYKKSFIKGNGIAGLTAEGATYSETEPDFGYLTITKVKVTAYTEITEELEKLPSLPYQAEVI
ncbi:MAG: phage major capsid protein, partial [Bacilli bacterium]